MGFQQPQSNSASAQLPSISPSPSARATAAAAAAAGGGGGSARLHQHHQQQAAQQANYSGVPKLSPTDRQQRRSPSANGRTDWAAKYLNK